MLLFYSAKKNRTIEALEKVLNDQLPTHMVLSCNSMKDFEKRLRRPHYHLKIVLLCICDAIEMMKLTELRPLLMDLRLLLVLPTQDEDTVAWAHRLCPRFIAYADNTIDQMAAVLEKMLGTGGGTNVLRMDSRPQCCNIRGNTAAFDPCG